MGSINVSNVGKAYKQYPTRWSRLIEWLDPRKKPRHQLHWVLQDINFTINSGEAVGIIGVNGAGKSTLLKMITGTTQPSSGEIHTTGRVAALLELGMGFHPDFTGKQNVFMAGQLLGLSADTIITLLPEIEAFADIGEYIDQPVRTYSSGMQARLAFSVATCVKPDILIVDEALSVGDMAFQAKCMQRMNVLLQSGITILFVSHALNQVRQFCNRALYLFNGSVKAFDNADYVCDLYQNDLALSNVTTSTKTISNQKSQPKLSLQNIIDPDLRKHSVLGKEGGDLSLEFLRFEILDKHETPISSCRYNDLLTIRTYIRANRDVPANAAIGLLIADKTGYHLFACNTNYYDQFLPELKAHEIVVVEWKFNMPFQLGELRIDTGIKPEAFSTIFYDRIFCAKTLNVLPDPALLKKNYGGYLLVDANVSISKLEQ